jgi:hypothetical protein
MRNFKRDLDAVDGVIGFVDGGAWPIGEPALNAIFAQFLPDPEEFQASQLGESFIVIPLK